MEGIGVGVIIAAAGADEALRLEALVRACDPEGLRVRRGTVEEARRALRAEAGGDVVVAGWPAAAEVVGSSEGTGDLPLVLVVPELVEAVATWANAHGTPVCLRPHGPAPLRAALHRVARRQSSPGSDLLPLVYTNVADVIFRLSVADDSFRFVEINPAFSKATGLAAEQVVGRLVEEVIPEPSLSLVLARYREAIVERRTVRWHEVTQYPSGSKHGEVSITPVVDASGRCRHLLGTVHDVTTEARARALKEAERRVLEMVASGATLSDTLTALTLAIEELAPPAIASVLLVSEDALTLLHGAAPHLPPEYSRALHGATVGPTAGSCGTAVALRRAVIVTDIEIDPLWEDYRGLVRPHGLRACWSTPILNADGRVIGTFALYYRAPRAPSDADLALIDRATHVAGIAIQRHELDEKLRGLSQRIEAVREQERTGIAREIHDQLGQALTAIKLDVAWLARRHAPNAEAITAPVILERLVAIGAMTDEVIRQVRRISSELRPGVLDDLGLLAAIEWAAQEFQQRTGVACSVASNLGDAQLDHGVSTAIFRILQEALTNVARHAEASRVCVELVRRPGWLRLDVQDDGHGITGAVIHSPRSLGLLGMRERARALGGRADVRTGERGGTAVSIEVPLVDVATETTA